MQRLTRPRGRPSTVRFGVFVGLLMGSSLALAAEESGGEGATSLPRPGQLSAPQATVAPLGAVAAVATVAPQATVLPSPAPRAPTPWPELAAVFPGLLVHGSGVWLQHRNQTAQRLLLLEGAGVFATLLSVVVLFQTGAARDVVGPTVLTTVAGTTTFALSFTANLYAAWAPREGFGAPARKLPWLESRVGYLYVYDPIFDYRHFLTTHLDGRLGAWHVSAGALHAPAQDNQRFELGAGYRVFGPRAGMEPARDGSYFEPQLGFSEHRFDGDGFLSRVLELKLEGRIDTDRYLPDVHGAFFQLEAGFAKQWFVHDLPGVGAVTPTSLLLAHAGFGMYLGHLLPRAAGGEVELFYDHRHDGFAGGLKVRGLGSGPAGHFGLAGSYLFSPGWGVRASTEVGSAWTLGLNLVIVAGPA